MNRRLTTKVQKIQGRPEAVGGVWAVSRHFQPPGEETRQRRGELWVVLELSVPPALDVNLALKIFFDTLTESYFSSVEGSCLSALEKAMLEARERLVGLVVGEEAVNFSSVCAALWGKVLYLGQIGRGAAYLLRGSAVESVGAEGEGLRVSSGMTQKGDVLILGSATFEKLFPPGKILESLGKIEEKIQQSDEAPRLAGLIARLEVETVPSEAEVLNLVPAASGGAASELRNWWGRISSRIPRRGRPLSIYLKDSRPRFRLSLGLGVFLAGLLLLGSVGYSVTRFTARRQRNEVAEALDQARANFEQASNLLDLDNQKARDLVFAARGALEEVQDYPAAGEEVGRALAEGEAILKKANKVLEVAPEEVFDFSALIGQSSLGAVGGVGDSLLVADGSGVYELDLAVESVAPKKLEGDLVRLGRISSEADVPSYVLGDELYSVDAAEGSVGAEDIGFEDFATTVDFKTYYGNLYFLLPARNQIVRIVPTDEGFSDPFDWVKGEIDLSGAVSLAVDGDVFVLKSSGEILKFTSGEREEFELVGLAEGLTEARRIYTSTDLPLLYVLDQAGKRLVLISKEGLFQKQYLFSEPAGDFVVPSEDSIFLISGSKLLRITEP